MTAARGASSVSGEEFELRSYGLSSIRIIVIVWAMWLLTFKTLSACVNLVIQRMIFLLLPTVGEFTAILIFAAVSIGLNKVLCFPL